VPVTVSTFSIIPSNGKAGQTAGVEKHLPKFSGERSERLIARLLHPKDAWGFSAHAGCPAFPILCNCKKSVTETAF